MQNKSKIRALVVDDEELARLGLIRHLEAFPEIEVLGHCENAYIAHKEILKQKPDVVFLDIKMPGMDGFELVAMLGDDVPNIIFVTAYDGFAIKAFETNALDYLLKPVNPKRLQQSIEKLRQQLSFNAEGFQKLMQEKLAENVYQERIHVRDGTDIHIIPAARIQFFEAQDDYVAIRTENDVYLKLERLSNIEESMDPAIFKRVHRSYLVNINFVESIENNKFAVLKSGHKVPVSRSGYNKYFR